MIAEVGLALLWMSVSLSGLILFGHVNELMPYRDAVTFRPRPIVQVQFAAAALSCGLYLFLFAQTDLSVRLVAEQSHAAMPMFDKILAGLNNGSGGAMICLCCVSVVGAWLAHAANKHGTDATGTVQFALSAISMLIAAFLLFVEQPFARLDPTTSDGRGAELLMQVEEATLAQPILSLGFAGLLISMSFGIACWFKRGEKPEPLGRLILWASVSWFFLTVGLLMDWLSPSFEFDQHGFYKSFLYLAWLLTSVLLVVIRPFQTISIPRWRGLLAVFLFGVALAIAGILSDGTLAKDQSAIVGIGETHGIGPYRLRLNRIELVAGPHWTAIEGVIEAKGEGRVFDLYPQQRSYFSHPLSTCIAAMHNDLSGRLSVILEQEVKKEHWQIKLSWRPYGMLRWIGGAMALFALLFTLWGHLERRFLAKQSEQDEQ